MAKSLAEIELSFRAQYPKAESEERQKIEGQEIERQKIEKQEYQTDTSMAKEIKKEKADEEDKKLKQKGRKASVISDIIFYLALVAMVAFAVLFSRGAFGSQTVGGYRFYEVLTTSMDSVYPRGSLILIEEVDANELVVGDDITFVKGSGDLITHRIEEIKENHEGSGSRAFVTKGVDNAAADADVVLAEEIVGKVVKGFTGLGAALSLIGSNLWIVLVLFLALMALSFFLKVFRREQKKIQNND